jgi:putative transposase
VDGSANRNCAALAFHVQTFDPGQEYQVIERRLPHWSQPGTLCFITWRTWDSMPTHVIADWLTEREAWLRRHGIDPSSKDWQLQLSALPTGRIHEFRRYVADRWNQRLDALHGACVLRQPALAQIVADSLDHFHDIRYQLTDYVVMPNHVHLLAAFRDEESMLAQCESWKRFTANGINRVLGRKGRFWQQDDFDHLVRSVEQFEHLRRYIAENPSRAGLSPGQYLHESKPSLVQR